MDIPLKSQPKVTVNLEGYQNDKFDGAKVGKNDIPGLTGAISPGFSGSTGVLGLGRGSLSGRGVGKGFPGSDSDQYGYNGGFSGTIHPARHSNLSTQMATQMSQIQEAPSTNSTNDSQFTLSSFDSKNYKLTRTYSESEKNNFDLETGHRLFDDGKIRPRISRQNSQQEKDYSPPKIYSRSHNESIDDSLGTKGLEDEYIPGLDFGDLIYRWNNNKSDQNLVTENLRFHDKKSTLSSTSTSISNTPSSNDNSYLDLNSLHSKLAPQPIRGVGPQRQALQINTNTGQTAHITHNSKLSYGKLTDFVKLRPPQETDEYVSALNSTATLLPEQSKTRKKQRSEAPDYEMVLNSLPANFSDLPYSQRKKLVNSFSDLIDYSQFSTFAKNYFNERTPRSAGSGIGRSVSVSGPGSGNGGGNSGGSGNGSQASVGSAGLASNGSFVRRSRRGSVNTVAGRLLASLTDLKRLEEKTKYNVDEKGAVVMEHVLGKVIGFGAWGTIRECTDRHGTVRAIKIVKSIKERDSRSSSPHRGLSPRAGSPHRGRSRGESPHRGSPELNPKVLQVFKKEIVIWKLLHHENILPLLKHLETNGSIFCIMNRIYGGTLFELVSAWGLYNGGIMSTSGPLEFLIEEQRKRLFQVAEHTRQIVNALHYMHDEMGIVHGDLKLENVLVEEANGGYKMILCDFGMSRVFTRVKRKSSMRLNFTGDEDNSFEDDDFLMMRSKSSTTDLRKPYTGGDTPSTRHLNFNDDSKIGISNMMKPHGPSLQSIDLTPVQSSSVLDFKSKYKSTSRDTVGIDSDLPHSHIGSLPYAAPELLSPSPPPLGPLADVWALGVLMFTMVVGRLPFQHQYEPRLRAIITAGKYNREDLSKACLLEWIFNDKQEPEHRNKIPESILKQSPSMVDIKRKDELFELHKSWMQYREKKEFQWLYDIIRGCLELNITKRWDLQMIKLSLEIHAEDGV